MVNLKGMPFNLSDKDIDWVQSTLASMTDEEKIGQLFCMVAYTDEENLEDMAKKYTPGGLMCRPMPASGIVNTVQTLQDNSRIPMLISANLEKGGNGLLGSDGTFIGSQMEVAATDDDEMAYKLGVVCGREASAAGANWSFAPIIDIDYNFRNPITNTRTFGSDPDRVRRMGVQYVKGVQQYQVAASIKHFPGDGMDERDQHLVASINSMSCEDWDKTYGVAYKASIEAGALSVMIGHILQPAYTRKFNPTIKDEDILPATLSYELVTNLLREQLGFNGLVVTDASTMAGMIIPMPREQAIPQSIAAGCDMFLFTKNTEEDYGYMRKGVQEGVITPERLDEAITRILALKASLKLHDKKEAGTLVPVVEAVREKIGTPEHKSWAKECADKSVTLVKEEKGVLPLSPQKYKKVLYYDIESQAGVAYSAQAGVAAKVMDMLKKEGFDVDVFKPNPSFEGLAAPYGEIVQKYDLLIYLANIATKSNQTTTRIEWAQPMGANVPVYVNKIPSIFISVENPYHLLDAPRVKTFINTYSSNEYVLEALVDKLMGRSAFKGVNPVDPFCGMWDTHL